MPKIIIKGTTVNIPASGASPSWAPAIIDAFTLTADAVNAFAGTYDVAPQTKNIDIYNSSSFIDINNLVFPQPDVRGVTIFYSVARKTSETTVGAGDNKEVSEAGSLELAYNGSLGAGLKWQIVRTGVGNASIDFNVTDLGQVQFTTTALTGISHTGTISYRAISVLN
jgi:hypothetical protein